MPKHFVTCLSSSSKHKDYCFWFCMEYFGHFTPVIHIYPSPSIQRRKGRVIFFLCEPHSCSQWMDKPVIVQFTQKTDYLIIVPTKTVSWTFNRRVPTMKDFDVKLNSHAHSSSFLSSCALSDCGAKYNKTLYLVLPPYYMPIKAPIVL